MAAGQRREAFLQAGLGGGFADLGLAPSAEHLQHRQDARTALKTRPWLKAASGRFLMIDLGTDSAVELGIKRFSVLAQGHDWQVGDKKLSGLILITDSLETDVDRQRVIDVASQVLPRFQKYGVHLDILFPKNGKGAAAEEKMELLRKIGGVDVQILTPNKGEFNLIEARTPFARSRRTPSNLLDNPKYVGWYRHLFKTMKQTYQDFGLKIIDSSAIIGALKHTTFPPKTIEALKSGFGVKLEVSCGCNWEVDLEGNPNRIFDCRDEACLFTGESVEVFNTLVSDKRESQQKTYLLNRFFVA